MVQLRYVAEALGVTVYDVPERLKRQASGRQRWPFHVQRPFTAGHEVRLEYYPARPDRPASL